MWIIKIRLIVIAGMCSAGDGCPTAAYPDTDFANNSASNTNTTSAASNSTSTNDIESDDYTKKLFVNMFELSFSSFGLFSFTDGSILSFLIFFAPFNLYWVGGLC